MSDVFVYLIDGFPAGIHEAVMPGADDDYSVYIDRGLSDRERLAAYEHALKHCYGDFERSSVQVIEYENHNDEKRPLHDRHQSRP